jgi:single-stranded DNA-binding protein
MRCSTGTDREGAALTSFVQVVCFGNVADTLAKMTQGDAISVQGPMKQTEYTRDDGEVRHGLEVVAQSILSPYQIKKKRGESEAKPSRDDRSGREQNAAYGDFVRGARSSPVADFDDPIGF